MTAPIEVAKNWTQLARLLVVHPNNLTKWKQKHADFPQSMVVAEWQEWKRRHALGIKEDTEKSTTDLRDEKLRTEIEINRIKIAKESRRVIDADKVDDLLLFLGSRLKAATYQTFVTELPPKTAGLDVSEVRKFNREGADAICLNMQHAVEDWQKEQAAAKEASAAATTGDGL